MQFGHAKHIPLAIMESPSKLNGTRAIETAEVVALEDFLFYIAWQIRARFVIQIHSGCSIPPIAEKLFESQLEDVYHRRGKVALLRMSSVFVFVHYWQFPVTTRVTSPCRKERLSRNRLQGFYLWVKFPSNGCPRYVTCTLVPLKSLVQSRSF